MLSIVIPTLNAATSLRDTLDACRALNAEIIICDGGSQDHTCDIAISSGAIVVTSDPNRGEQLASGAAAASGEWLLFLHADSVPENGWHEFINDFINAKGTKFRAGVFQFKLDDPTKQARRIEWWANLRTRILRLPYGDQGLLISRAYYEGLGGFRPLPLMEDVDFIRRIGRSGLIIFPCAITTSSVRYQRGGYWSRPIKNLCLLSLYYLGVPAKVLHRFYA